MAIINPKQIRVPFNKLKTVFQISDIHIRLFKRHKEYREVFATLYKQLFLRGQMFEASIILVSGDILHAKTDLSPEMVALASEFLTKLADISPTLVIVGNHDLNLANSFRLDSLSPIIQNISHSDLYYLKDSGIYTVADTDFALHSIIGDRKEWPKPRQCKSPTRIALLHAPVNEAKTDTGFTITSRHVDISTFTGFDMVMLGDIHRHQILQEYDLSKKKPLIAYAGSMIQQNHGEKLKGHGTVEWDIPSRSLQFKELPNTYGYATLIVEDGKMPDLSHIPENARLRVFVKELEISQIKKLESILKKKFNLQEFIVNKLRDDDLTLDNQRHAAALVDVQDIETQNKLIEDYLTRHHAMVDSELMSRIHDLNKKLNMSISTEDLSRNVRWRPKLFEFSNMFSYGENNSINFENMNGIHGLFSPNASGKTAAFDALMFCLYDKTPRAYKAKHIMNNRRRKFHCQLIFEINGVEYGLKRIGTRKKNGEVKVDVSFWKVDGSQKILLNAEDRRTTNAVIRRYVGTYEDFILTSLSVQNNSTIFIDKTQSERKDLLSQFMGTNIFDTLYQLALDEMKESRGALKRLSRTDLAEMLTETQNQIDSIGQEYTKIEIGNSEKEVDLEKLERSIAALYESKTPLDLADFDIGKLEVTKTELQSSLTLLSDAAIDLSRVKDELKSTSGSLSVENRKYNSDDIVGRYEKATKYQQKMDSVELQLSLLGKQIQSVESQLDHVSHEFDPSCDFCVKNNESLMLTEKRLRSELISTKRERTVFEKLKDEHTKELVDYDEILVEYEQAEIVRETLQETAIKLLSLSAKLSDMKSSITSKKSRLKDVTTKIKQYYKSVDIIEKNSKLDEKISDAEQRQKELFNELKTQEIKLRGLHGKMQVQKATKTSVLKQLSELEELEQIISAYEYYVEAVKRDGIPYELIIKIIPSIQSEINNILLQIADFTVTLEVDGKNINGRISYGDDRHWPLEVSSGMERFISSLAIRVALITVSNLPKPNFLIIDEGLGTLSSENLMSMHLLFSILKNQFDFIIIISHLEAVRDMVDSLMEIQLNNGYSKINY